MRKPKRHLWRWALGFAILLLLGGAAAFYFFSGFQAVRSRNIEIAISAPQALEGGERITWEVLIANRNRKALESAELFFEYPQGTKVLDPHIKGLRERRGIGRIGPDETVKSSFEAFLFGEEGEEKTVQAALEYRAEDSSAILAKEAGFATRILRSPLGISFELPREARMQQELELKINYVSNAKSETPDLFLELDVPPGFSIEKTIPEAEEGGRTWRLGSIKPQESGVVIVGGKISGEDLETKSFKARIVARDESGGIPVYGAGTAALTLRKPFLEIGTKINGEKLYLVRAGETVRASIAFRNNLSVPVHDVIIEAVFSGEGLDERTIRVHQGNYRLSSRSAVWNASSAEVLRQLPPGQGGTVTLEFSFLDPPPLQSSKDQNFRLAVEAKIMPGTIPPGLFGSDLSAQDAAEVKLKSEVQLAQRGFYYSKTIPNSGPLPPQVGGETTFTVVWSLTNSTNEVGDLVMRSSIPAYVSWKGLVVPREEAIEFNPNTGEIIWKVGSLKAGTGFLRPAREVAFQIGLIAGPNQIGSSPRLVSRVVAEGRDLFTDSPIHIEAEELTTGLRGDPKIMSDDTRVVP